MTYSTRIRIPNNRFNSFALKIENSILMSRTTNYRLVQGMGLVSKYCLILALVCPWGVNGQGVVYVDSDANGVGDGSSWPDAFTSLQDALLAWSPGASVWVAEGVYHPDQGQGVSLGDKEAVFQLPAGMRLIGGFSGDETSEEQRQLGQFVSLLSGDLSNNDGGDFPIGSLSRNDNSDRIVEIDNALQDRVIIDGFTIDGGHAPTWGGGVYVGPGGSATIRNTKFQNNVAMQCGGGLASLGTVYVSHSLFENNYADYGRGSCAGGSGGALYQYTASDYLGHLETPRVEWTEFRNNHTEECGGGLASGEGGLDVSNSIFSSNTSGYGGGACLGANFQEGPSRYFNVRFYGNVANDYGGGGFYSSYGNVLFANAVFSGNGVGPDYSTSWGGAAYLERSVATFHSSSFFENYAERGTLFYMEKGELSVLNSILHTTDSSDSTWVAAWEPDSVIVTSSLIPALSPSFVVHSDVLHGDPGYFSPFGVDGLAGSPDDDLSLRSDSPLRDIGNDSLLPHDLLDLDNDGDMSEAIPHDVTSRFRVHGGQVDMGAYEFGASAHSTVDGFIGQENVEWCSQIQVYPNPSAGRIRVRMPKSAVQSSLKLEVFDILGRSIRTQQKGWTDSAGVELILHSAGAYLLFFRDVANDHVCVRKSLIF